MGLSLFILYIKRRLWTCVLVHEVKLDFSAYHFSLIFKQLVAIKTDHGNYYRNDLASLTNQPVLIQVNSVFRPS